MTTTYQWSSTGDLIEVDGPSIAGVSSTAVLARAYDSAGRVIAESDQPIAGGTTVASPLRAYEYVMPSASAPGAVKTYTFASRSPSFTAGAVPQTDDSTQTIRYFDALGRPVQVRTRLGSGIAPQSTNGNVVKSLAAQYWVTSSVLLDGLGRTTASLEPYFSSTGSFVDPRSGTELSTPGLHATTVAYDALSRRICQMYSPVSGSIVPAPTDASACISNYSEGANYKRATRTGYRVDSSLDTRAYLVVDTVADWAAAASTPGSVYVDALGRALYTRTPSGTYEKHVFDQLNRMTNVIRYPGIPPSSAPTVASSWAYDKRGRVTQEFADASGYRIYTYLPTGEAVQVLQNPAATATTADAKSVWSTQIVGTLGRIVERDDFRWQIDSTCASAAPHEDVTKFQYDTAYPGQEVGRYGFTAGRLTAVTGPLANVAVALGYNSIGMVTVRDEWVGDGGTRNSVVDTRGADGRLLSRAITSSYLAGYNSISTFGYAVGYDSAGRPVQLNPTYDAAGTFTPISSTTAGSAYWLAGTGTDPVTGAYDSLGRLAGEKWDAGAVNKASAFLPGSNLPASYSTTLSAANTNVYSAQSLSWQGTLLTGYTLTSAWEGSGTSYAAAYDADAHLMAFSAAPVNLLGSASQQINEGYAFTLENLSAVNATNSLGVNISSTYNYADSTSRERVTSMTSPNAPTADHYLYDRRGRGLITQHKLTTAQSPAQDAYEYDSLNRLISISHLGVKREDLAYDGLGDLVSRQFTNGTDTARYYVGDELTGVNRNSSTKIGYVHIRLGTQRIASFWVKAVGTVQTAGIIYYHRGQRGDVVATTTAGGQIGMSYRYLPSGALDKVVGTEDDTNTSELGFIGGLKLSGGLIHLKARAYAPALRRFLQPDTVDLKRYTYAHGDPINLVDPSGRDPTEDPPLHPDGPPEPRDPSRPNGTEEINVTGDRNNWNKSCGYSPCSVTTGPFFPPPPTPMRSSTSLGPYGRRISIAIRPVTQTMRRLGYAGMAVVCLGGACETAPIIAGLGAVALIGAMVFDIIHSDWNQAHSDGNTKADTLEVPPSVPSDPAEAPGDGWEWKGKGEPGASKGSWYNPATGESLHPDLDHPAPVGPHWDYIDPDGRGWRIFPDGSSTPK